MRLLFDLVMIFYMLVLAYALGRRRSDGTKVIPVEVTSYAMVVLLAIFILINLPSLIGLAGTYGK
ncbi:hypothetical protein FT641_18050 [Bacillus paranthracis]|uniref:hypothetical protein n=1 Tax=Bacillus paranthracis TaxID=2026186 RepID=UPI00187A8A76|nr:hypothetical protein [Bacillus paranthracis]MBE7114535.1 hypothetical protein [Bacillus paranthracis]MBE7154591.1 hypothetical protein [Bacillus paranthracis]